MVRPGVSGFANLHPQGPHFGHAAPFGSLMQRARPCERFRFPVQALSVRKVGKKKRLKVEERKGRSPATKKPHPARTKDHRHKDKRASKCREVVRDKNSARPTVKQIARKALTKRSKDSSTHTPSGSDSEDSDGERTGDLLALR